MSEPTGLPFALPPLAGLKSPTAFNARPPAGQTDGDGHAAARAQANEFEATFLSALLQPIFEGLARDSTFGGGFAEETWTGLLTQEYAKGISSSANLGIANQVYEQLIKLQESPGSETSPSALSVKPARSE